MPQLYLSNPGIFESVTRPVVLEITRQLLAATGLPEKTKIQYPGDAGRVIQPGSSVDEHGTDDATTFAYTQKVHVDVDEQDNPDRIFSVAVMRAENRAIFLDQRVNTSLTPVYSPQDVTITFRYQARDKTSAMRWRDEMRGRLGNEQDTQRLHRLSYAWTIPEEYMVILKEIYTMMMAAEPYAQMDSFAQWFQACASSRVTDVTTFAGTVPVKTVRETQMRVVGYFDFDTLPEKGEKDADGDAWTIGFSYKFQYEKPVGCVMRYPLMVHNQLIKYRPAQPEEQVDAHLRSFSNSSWAFRQFEKGNHLLTTVDSGIAIPPFDEFIPASTVPSTQRLFTALTSVDTQGVNPRLLMNLAELGEQSVLHPRVLRFLRGGEWSWISRPYLSVFNVSLYRNEYLLPYQKVDVNAGLDVVSTEDLSLRNFYHVRFGYVEDFSLLSQAAQERLRANADIVCLVLLQLGLQNLFPQLLGCNMTQQDILDALALNEDDPKDFCNNYITRAEWDKLITGMNAYFGANSSASQVRQFNTVMTLSIQAYKESDLADR